MEKVISKETHTKCSVRTISKILSDVEFLVPNHLIDENGHLDEEFGKQISGLVEGIIINPLIIRFHHDDYDLVDREQEVVGMYEIIKDDFDPDLPVMDEVRMKEEYSLGGLDLDNLM